MACLRLSAAFDDTEREGGGRERERERGGEREREGGEREGRERKRRGERDGERERCCRSGQSSFNLTTLLDGLVKWVFVRLMAKLMAHSVCSADAHFDPHQPPPPTLTAPLRLSCRPYPYPTPSYPTRLPSSSSSSDKGSIKRSNLSKIRVPTRLPSASSSSPGKRNYLRD